MKLHSIVSELFSNKHSIYYIVRTLIDKSDSCDQACIALWELQYVDNFEYFGIKNSYLTVLLKQGIIEQIRNL